MKKLTLILSAVLCVLALLNPLSANAINSEPSNMTVIMKYGDEPLGGINVAVCRVADAREVSGGIVYDAAPEFSGAGADFTNLTTARNVALAASLNAYAAANGIARSAKVTDSSGRAVFTGLSAGLYLVAQLDSETSEYVIAPYLAALPALHETRTGEWDYNVTAYPKTEPYKLESSSPSSSSDPTGSSTPSISSTPSTSSNSPNPRTRTDGPKTNDESSLQLWLLLLSVSVIGLFAIICIWKINRKRKMLEETTHHELL